MSLLTNLSITYILKYLIGLDNVKVQILIILKVKLIPRIQ